jgi:OPA family glycerol-3-phosphate transporter-like MFS transporter
MTFHPLAALRRFFAPPPPAPRLPPEEVSRLYPRLRWQMLEATFIGYATFYLVRNNLSPVKADLQTALGYSKSMLGSIDAVAALSYGVGKFFLGAISDRSDPRKFMATGLALTALCNFAFGATADYQTHLWLWGINGFFQGMGWPPCGRTMGHWFSESERGLKFSIWNTSHNVGGAIAGYLAAKVVTEFGGWQYAFFIPGVIALVGAVYIYARLRDTPQSVGLPPIEEYRHDYPPEDTTHFHERELTFRELFLDKVLLNPWIWLLAVANFFAYVTRYAMIDWGPTYYRAVKGATRDMGGFTTTVFELGGVPSTIALGWLSDKVGGRRGMIAALSMIPIVAAYLVIAATEPGYLAIDMVMLAVIGFFIYPVINLITIAALDIASKKAIGAAAGFIGLAGYIGRMVESQGIGSLVDVLEPTRGAAAAWQFALAIVASSGVIAFLLLTLTWKIRPRA